MFRDLYKQANDEIKGDRTILDKAFLQAAQPEKKKSPVIKYSFIGTAVAAVLVLGAVFANPSVFTKRSEDLKRNVEVAAPTEATEVIVQAVEELADVDDAPIVANEAELSPKTKITTSKKLEGIVTDETPQNQAIHAGGNGIATMSLEDEDNAVAYEVSTEEVAIGFSLRDRGIVEDVTEYIDAEEIIEEVSEDNGVAVEAFSYMYDLSCDYYAITEGFENVEVSPVTSSEEAIERARREYHGEYDTINVYYDPIECIWKVVFSCDDEVASQMIIYMDSDGITLRIVNQA